MPDTVNSLNDLVLEGKLLVSGSGCVQIVVRNGIVAKISHVAGNGDGRFISAGWIDLQINGCNGSDINSADVEPEVVASVVRSAWNFGVAGLCPTICTQSEARIIRSLKAVAKACEADPLVALSVLGIHVEGPFICGNDGPRGAHPSAHVRPPNLDEYRRWQAAAGGTIRIVTLSPEYDESIPFIREVVRDGVVVSIGHTAATSDQIRAAVDAGATWSTHLGNGADALIARHPNYIWDQLSEDRLGAGLIFDGHHLPPAFMRAAVRSKTVEKCILVSDAVAEAGLPSGIYRNSNGGSVELSESGRLTLLVTPYLAGSACMLPVCVSNAVRYADVTLARAVRMVTTNPSRLLGLSVWAGHEELRVGSTANFTVFRQALDTGSISVLHTILAGKIVSTLQPL